MRTVFFAMLFAVGTGLVAASASSAAPANGVVIGQAAVAASLLSEVGYVRRRGRTCYSKCYYEFIIGRRVCRTYC